MPEARPSSTRRSDRDKRMRLLEDILIILCILPLWPAILSWQQPLFKYLMYLALVTLVVIFFRRIKRFRQVRDELRD